MDEPAKFWIFKWVWHLYCPECHNAFISHGGPVDLRTAKIGSVFYRRANLVCDSCIQARKQDFEFMEWIAVA